MKVALTGANGFLGYHVVQQLLAAGAEIKALYGPPTLFDPLLPDIRFLRGDICDPALLATLVEGADTVIHLAGPPSVAASFQRPADFVRIHGAGTAELLAAAVKAGVRRLVYISSAQVYGLPRAEFVAEDHPLEPRSPYAAAKICGEKLVETYHRAFNLETVILRPFSIYGRGSSPDAVLNRIIDMARADAPVVLHDLRPVLDYCFVDDVARALVHATHAPVSGQVFNIGSMFPVSLQELAQNVMGLLSCRSALVEDVSHRRPGASTAMRLVADNTRARQYLDWTPLTNLQDGLRLTLGLAQ